MAIIKSLARSMRPHHWIKNLLVFAPIFFSNQLSLGNLWLATNVFIAFSLASSGSYVLNDVFDRKRDLFHPLKKERPIASQKLPLVTAVLFSLLLQVSALALSFRFLHAVTPIIGAYLLIQIAYSAYLKKQPLIDVLVVALGYVLRALAGAVGATIILSPWFILCVGFLALYLGFVKRRAELTGTFSISAGAREVLSQYSLEFLTLIEQTCLTAILMIYVIWTVLGSLSPWMITTIPFVFYGLFKHHALTLKDNLAGESPEVVWMKDPAILISFVLWLTVCFVVLQLS